MALREQSHGARASANLYFLVTTARANGLEPCAYLNFLFENLPAAETVEALEALRPTRSSGSFDATLVGRIDARRDWFASLVPTHPGELQVYVRISPQAEEILDAVVYELESPPAGLRP